MLIRPGGTRVSEGLHSACATDASTREPTQLDKRRSRMLLFGPAGHMLLAAKESPSRLSSADLKRNGVAGQRWPYERGIGQFSGRGGG